MGTGRGAGESRLWENGREGRRPGTAPCAGAAGPGSPRAPSDPPPASFPAQDLLRRAEQTEKQARRGRAHLAEDAEPAGKAKCCGH